MEILNLYDHQHFVPQISEWIYWEFVYGLRKGISLNDVRSSFHRRQADKMPLTYVGTSGGVPIGTVSLVDNDLKERGDLTPWLAGLYIQEEYRALSYAQVLIEKTIKSAAAFGYGKLYLRTETAANYYKKLGWWLNVPFSIAVLSELQWVACMVCGLVCHSA